VDNETVIIGESEAERLAYDGLEDLCAVWRIRAASKLTTAAVEQPFELSRVTLKGKVATACKRPVKPARSNGFAAIINRVSQAVSGLFTKLEFA
jgi:hypothetical protein